ncbi:hypothetical protein SH139x_005748 [Planctomycetaceae bacterium SH139]
MQRKNVTAAFCYVCLLLTSIGCIRKVASDTMPIGDGVALDSCLAIALDLSHGFQGKEGERTFPLTLELIEEYSSVTQGARGKIVLSQISGYDQIVLFEGSPDALKQKFSSPDELKRFLLENSQAGETPVFEATGKTFRYINQMRDVGPRTHQVVVIIGTMKDSETDRSERSLKGHRMFGALKQYHEKGGNLALYLVHEDEVWRWQRIFELAEMDSSRYLISNRFQFEPELPRFD